MTINVDMINGVAIRFEMETGTPATHLYCSEPTARQLLAECQSAQADLHGAWRIDGLILVRDNGLPPGDFRVDNGQLKQQLESLGLSLTD